MEFHEKLQELRKQKNLTQEELSEILFVSRTAISKWESGRGYPSIDSLKAIAEFFGVTIKALYQLLIVCPYWFNSISLCDLGYLLNCLPLHLSIGPCIDPGCVDVGMPKELREEDKRHPGTIQMHGTGMPKLVWMYSFWHFRTSPPCHFTIFFHKEINGIGGHSAFATMIPPI